MAKKVKLEKYLQETGFIRKDSTLTAEEIEDATIKVLEHHQKLFKNIQIILEWQNAVFTSLSLRGKYPEELMRGSPFFLNRDGFADIQMVLNQVKLVQPKKEEETDNG